MCAMSHVGPTLPRAERLRAAVVQAAPIAFDRERTLAKACDLVAQAAGQGAQLLVFPEAFLSAYPRGASFGTVVGLRARAGYDAFKRYWESAVDVPGPVVDALAAASRRHGVYLAIGVVERDGGTLYCTVLFFSPDGYLGKHRKLMPTAAERLVWGFGDGSTLPVFDTPFGRLGAVICWENYMPLLRTAMYAKGIQLYCAPTADQRDTWLATMRHIAVEGRCFVLSCNQFARRRDYPDDYETSYGNDPETVVTRGGSCIVTPFGELVAGPNFEGETILIADLDLGDLIRGKYDFDVTGHYARPDVFQLIVDERRKTPVHTVAAPTTAAVPEAAGDVAQPEKAPA
ncbi:MAG TPA: nitrilase-related carbon-nitrogen hydrolase [bacterium]|nr:nitrilase-related carbon-nitrogen hydrolase [bacterium]